MNIKRIYNRVKDSSSDVSQEISDISHRLTELGVDFEAQDIGESDKEYFEYLQEMLPPVKDDTEDDRNLMKSDKLSALIPQLDFPKELDASDINGDEVYASEEEENFEADIDAGGFGIKLFGSWASLKIEGHIREGMKSSDYDVPDDVIITSSDLSLDSIEGIYIFEKESNTPVVFMSGGFDPVDMWNFKGWASVASGAAKAKQRTIPQFGTYNSGVLAAIDNMVEEYIGKQTFTAKSRL